MKVGLNWGKKINNFTLLFQKFVFSHPMPENRDQLVEKINRVWEQNITVDLIKRAAVGFINRARKVVEADGKHQTNE